MYVTRELMSLMKEAEETLSKYEEDELAQEIHDMLITIKTKRQVKNNYNNDRNKKLRGTYKGDE